MADEEPDTRDLSRANVSAFVMNAGRPVERPRVAFELIAGLRLPDDSWHDALSVVVGDVALGIVSYTGGAGPTNRSPAEKPLPARAITNMMSIDFVAGIPLDAPDLVARAEPFVRRGHDVLRIGDVRAGGDDGPVVARTSSWWHVIEGGHDPRARAADRAEAHEQGEASNGNFDAMAGAADAVAVPDDLALVDPGRSPLAALLGLRLTRADESGVDVLLLDQSRFRNSGGTLFGGACGLLLALAAEAAIHAQTPGIRVIPNNVVVHYLRPAGGGTVPVRCTGTVLRRGRNVAHADAVAFANDGRPAVTARLTAALEPHA